MDGEISGELQEFLSSGTPPVYMVFGSGMTCHERDTISLLSETAKKAPTRAVIQAPNWKEYGFKSTDRVHFVSSAPHTAIFPQCSVIVHHGGAGTSQTALLAGTPSVVVSHTSEQAFWGRELEGIGVAGKQIFWRDCHSDNLSTAIKRVIESREVSQMAKQIGTEMAKENGVATAVRMINDRFMA